MILYIIPTFFVLIFTNKLIQKFDLNDNTANVKLTSHQLILTSDHYHSMYKYDRMYNKKSPVFIIRNIFDRIWIYILSFILPLKINKENKRKENKRKENK